jgi:hypothetical protein
MMKKHAGISIVIFFVLGNVWTLQAQYLGVTMGWDYSNDLYGPNTGTHNTPLFNPDPSRPDRTWDDWAEELGAAGVDYVCPNLRGAYGANNFGPLISALQNRGLANKIKLAIFDDNASSWTARWNQDHGYGFNYTVPFDISNSANWVYLWDYNYRPFYQTVPDANRFKLNGRPVIIIWTGNNYFISNTQGNVSRALTYVRQQCQAEFGFNPYIILSGDFLPNDTTCNNPAITDAIENWFLPDSSHANNWSLGTFNGVKIGALCPQFQDPIANPANWIDPDHGNRLANGLSNTRGNGAFLTLVEGFTDWEEDAACFRVRSLDPSGNALGYSSTYYDYPNQRINILRRYGNNPFPAELKFEAEGCDYFGGGSPGSNYYRNGNIGIEPTSDAGGGFDVGWINANEWLEWREVPIQGSAIHLQVRVASPNSNCRLHFVVDGSTYPTLTIPNTGGWQAFTTIESGAQYQFPKGSTHTVRLVCETGGFNINYWQYHNDLPIGALISLKAQANNLWVTAPNSGASPLIASSSTAGTAESFTVIDASGNGYGTVALQASINNKYVKADPNGPLPLSAASTAIGPWELFQWIDNGDGSIALRSMENMLVVCADNSGSQPLIANRANAGLWETFTLGTPGGSLPSPWQTQDIGSVGATGNAVYSGGTFTVTGAGPDIWNNADAFRYVYQSSSGDCGMTARVATLQNTDAWAKGGVMIRESTAAGARNAAVVVTPGNGISFQWRASTGGSSSFASVTGLSAPYWVRLTRTGNSFAAYYSANGSSWTQFGGTQNIAMGTGATIGLAATSHISATLCTATFNNVTAVP